VEAVCLIMCVDCSQTEQSYKANPKLLAQLQHCEQNKIPFAVLLGESEMQRGVVKVRVIETREETEVPKEQLVAVLLEKIAQLTK
jgi:histidyl-tRNA synthetase